MPDETEWLSPSPRLLRVRLTQVAVVAVPALLLGVVVPLLAGSASTAVVLGSAVVLAAAVALVVCVRRLRAWGYAERADDLLVRRGLVVRRLSVVPYGRMQFVDVDAGPFERVFGLATVRLHTAAAASDARIPGLPADEARRLRDLLAERGEARSMGL